MTEVKVNPKIYPLDVIYSAAYSMLDKAYVLLSGDAETEVIVSIKPKDNTSTNLADEFTSELLNWAVYKTQSEKNADIRKAIIQRALLTNGFNEEEKDDDNYLDDPEGIAIPWEEKYGKDQS